MNVKEPWQTGKPDEKCFCFINLGDHIELAWYSSEAFGGCWFKHAEQSFTFEDFIEDEEIKCWVKAKVISRLLQNQKMKKQALKSGKDE